MMLHVELFYRQASFRATDVSIPHSINTSEIKNNRVDDVKATCDRRTAT
jgi:hypothetical protein